MKKIDRKLLKLGFVKKIENNYGATYEKKNKKHNFIQEVGIVHKNSNKCVIFSYEKTINSDGLNNTIGLSTKEMKLFMKKCKQLKKKYKWEVKK